MTKTLRNLSFPGWVTKGNVLTASEVDANFLDMDGEVITELDRAAYTGVTPGQVKFLRISNLTVPDGAWKACDGRVFAKGLLPDLDAYEALDALYQVVFPVSYTRASLGRYDISNTILVEKDGANYLVTASKASSLSGANGPFVLDADYNFVALCGDEATDSLGSTVLISLQYHQGDPYFYAVWDYRNGGVSSLRLFRYEVATWTKDATFDFNFNEDAGSLGPSSDFVRMSDDGRYIVFSQGTFVQSGDIDLLCVDLNGPSLVSMPVVGAGGQDFMTSAVCLFFLPNSSEFLLLSDSNDTSGLFLDVIDAATGTIARRLNVPSLGNNDADLVAQLGLCATTNSLWKASGINPITITAYSLTDASVLGSNSFDLGGLSIAKAIFQKPGGDMYVYQNNVLAIIGTDLTLKGVYPLPTLAGASISYINPSLMKQRVFNGDDIVGDQYEGSATNYHVLVLDGTPYTKLPDKSAEQAVDGYDWYIYVGDDLT